MPRSPSDATRFTATGPYAASGPSFGSNVSSSTTSASPGSQINFGASAPENETPQQKIARLRAAAMAAKQGQETQFDRVVRVGRGFADRAHRITAIGLIGLTVVSLTVATAGVTDMMMHNRKRRKEWLAEQRAKSARELVEARAAQAQGTATEDQILTINRERAAAEAEAARRNRPGVFKRATSWVFGGSDQVASSGSNAASEELLGEKEDRGLLEAVKQEVDANRRTGESVEEVLRPLGGPLDRQAERATTALSDARRHWASWITGR